MRSWRADSTWVTAIRGGAENFISGPLPISRCPQCSPVQRTGGVVRLRFGSFLASVPEGAVFPGGRLAGGLDFNSSGIEL